MGRQQQHPSHRDRHHLRALLTAAPPNSKAPDMVCTVMKQLGPPSHSQTLGCKQLRPPPARNPRISLLGGQPWSPPNPSAQGRADCTRWGQGTGNMCVHHRLQPKRKAKTKTQGLDVFLRVCVSVWRRGWGGGMMMFASSGFLRISRSPSFY